MQAVLDSAAFATGRIEGIAVGNIDKAFAQNVAEAARGVFTARGTAPASPSQFDRWRAVQLPPQVTVNVAMSARNASEQNSAHMSVWQGTTQSDVHAEVLNELAAHIVKRPAFHQLRTVEQIGYLVWSYATTRAAVPHLAFLLQSTELGATQIGHRVRAFLRQWRATFEVCHHRLYLHLLPL